VTSRGSSHLRYSARASVHTDCRSVRTYTGAKITEPQLEGVADRNARRTFLGFIQSATSAKHFYSANDFAATPFHV